MRPDDVAESVGTPVRDVYGRSLGNLIGYTLDGAGNIKTIGVEHGSVFTEYAGNSIISAKEEVILLPAWKAESRELGVEKGVLDSRLKTLDKLRESGDVSQRIYEQLYQSIVVTRETHEILSQRLVTRLEELLTSDDGIDLFLARIRLQASSCEAGEKAYDDAAKCCSAMKSINENEREDLKSVLEVIQPYVERPTPEEPLSEEREVETEPEVEFESETQPPEKEGEIKQEEPSQVFGTLRSLGG